MISILLAIDKQTQRKFHGEYISYSIDDNSCAHIYENGEAIFSTKKWITVELAENKEVSLRSLLQTSHETTTKASDNDVYEECELKS